MTISWEEFERVELRTATITRVEDFPEAKKPAYKLWLDIGDGGPEKTSSARITTLYTKDELVGKQVVVVTNFPPRQIGPVRSEVLVTGFYHTDDDVVLAVPERAVKNGLRLG